MWYQPSQPVYSIASPTKFEASDPELHAHSPRRRTGSIDNLRDRTATRNGSPISVYGSMPPPPAPSLEHESKGYPWASQTLMADPFVESGMRFMQNRYMARSSDGDQSMPDYSHSITPASSRNATNDFTNHTRPPSVLPSNDPQFDELIDNLRSRHENSSGTSAPANTRVSSAANTPPIQHRPSAAAEARAASYTQGRSRAVSNTTRDPPPIVGRENSDTSMKSRCSDELIGKSEGQDVKIQSRPTSEVRGRKEGRAKELEVPSHARKKSSKGSVGSGGKENTKATVTTTVILSEGKRKRASTVPGSNIVLKGGDVPSSSPTRKLSRKDAVADLSVDTEEIADESNLERAPLGSLDNIR